MSRIFFGTPRVSRVIRVTRDARTSRARPLIYRRNCSGSYLHSHRYKMFIRAVVSNYPLIITWMVRKTMEINAIAWSQVRDQFKRGFVPDLLAIAFNSWTTCNYLSRTCYTEHFFAQLVLQWWLWSIAIARAGVLHYAMKSLRRNVSLKTNLQLQLNRSCQHKSYSFVWFAFKVGLFFSRHLWRERKLKFCCRWRKCMRCGSLPQNHCEISCTRGVTHCWAKKLLHIVSDISRSVI